MHSLEKLKPLALLLLRLGLGIILVYHGYPKLFTHTHDAMQGFEHMGFPGYFVYIAGVVEFFGGCLLIAGIIYADRGTAGCGRNGCGAGEGARIVFQSGEGGQLPISAGRRTRRFYAGRPRRGTDLR